MVHPDFLVDLVVEQELEMILVLDFLRVQLEQVTHRLLLLHKETLVVEELKLHLVVITPVAVEVVLQVRELMVLLVGQVVMVVRQQQVQLMEHQPQELVVVLVVLIPTQQELYQVVAELVEELHYLQIKANQELLELQTLVVAVAVDQRHLLVVNLQVEVLVDLE